MVANNESSDMTPGQSAGKTPSASDGGQDPQSAAGASAGSVDESMKPRFRVVGIGASAGGLEALTEFFQAMRSRQRHGLRGRLAPGPGTQKRPGRNPDRG